jgi:hypothetical protein
VARRGSEDAKGSTSTVRISPAKVWMSAIEITAC